MPPLDAAAGKDDWVTAPSAASAATAAPAASAGKDDWVTAPAQHWAAPVGGEFGDLSAQASAPAPPQGQVGADVNAVGQGLVSGTGAVIAGAGRLAQAGTGPSAERVLAALDLVDEGKNRDAYQKLSDSERQQVGAYRGSRPDDKVAQRAALQQTVADYATPNTLTRVGMAVEGAAPTLFPVSKEKEGIQTGVGRIIGGAAPALAAGALGGPPGVLASMAILGSQAYDGAYQDAIANGASHAVADDAAGKSALAQAASLVAPVGRILKLVPVPLRAGLSATLVNLGQHGVEFGAGNALGTFAQNYVASQTFDPDRSLMQGTGQAGLEGLIAGLIIRGAATGVGAARAQPGPGPRAPAAPVASVDGVMAAPDIDGAIAAATQASQAPSGGTVGRPGMYGGEPDVTKGPFQQQSTAPTWGELFKPPASDSAGGNPVMTTASGLKVPYRFDVAEAADLIPASGDLQPRDRAGRVASSGQIFKMANTLDPELLHASPGPDQGAPSVTDDGVILAGNGRAAAIRQAYAMGNGADYRAMVDRYGFDTSGMSQPVLIRRLDPMAPEQARQIAVDSNIPTGQRMSGTEQAAIDAGSLTPDLLAQYNPLLTGGATAAGNRGFVRAWVGTLPESERNAAMGADGAISADGVRRLQGAMLSVAYGDKGTLSRSLESTDDNTRALTGALTDAAPAWAQLQAEITAGRVPPEMNVAAQLTRAVDLVRQAREKGQTIGDALSQGDAFDPLDPVTAGFLRAFANPALTGAASRSLVADILRRYAIEAGKASTAPGLFGDAEPPVAPADIVATVTAAAHAKTPIAATSAPGSPAAVAGQVQAAPPALAPAVAVRPSLAQSAAPPLPQSVGAAASRDTTSLTSFGRTAREIRGQQADMEMADLMRTPKPGDARDIIPGASQTRAEIEQSPTVSREAKGLRQEFRGGFNEDEKANNELFHQWVDQVTPSYENLGTMADQREAQWKADEQGVFGADPNGQPVSTEPLVQHFEGIFADPVQKSNSYLRKAFQPFVDALTDSNGDPIVMGAKELYGIRQEMARKVKAMATDPDLAQVRGEFGTLLKLTDSVIMSGASNYRAMMDNYQAASKQITAGQRLAEGALKITNGSDRVITFGRFDAFMKNMWLERHGPNAYAPAKDIPQATWDHLMLLHERLARSASDQELARTRGSDTTQLMMELARKGMTAAAHIVVGGMTHGVGNIFIPGIADHMATKRSLRLVEQHRHPDLSKYPTPGP